MKKLKKIYKKHIKIDKKKIILLGIILFSLYLFSTNYIQSERLYPWNQEGWFTYSMIQSYAPTNCFVIEPNYLEFNNEEGMFKVYTYFQKECDFTYSITFIHIKDVIAYSVDNPNNLKINVSENLSNPYQLKIIVNSSDMEDNKLYRMDFEFKLKDDFYNVFHLWSPSGTKIEQFKVIFDKGLFGYMCSQDCFTILEGDIKLEENFFGGNSKKFRFNIEDDVKIQFSPQSKFWFFAQKIIDTLMLGILAVIIYELFNLWILKKK